MINLIPGKKGTGKTKILVEAIKKAAESATGNVVCIERGMQLTYDLPQSIFAGDSFVKGVSVYVSGSNLLTIAKERKYMELNVGTAPQTRMYNLGVKVNL